MECVSTVCRSKEVQGCIVLHIYQISCSFIGIDRTAVIAIAISTGISNDRSESLRHSFTSSSNIHILVSPFLKEIISIRIRSIIEGDDTSTIDREGRQGEEMRNEREQYVKGFTFEQILMIVVRYLQTFLDVDNHYNIHIQS